MVGIPVPFPGSGLSERSGEADHAPSLGPQQTQVSRAGLEVALPQARKIVNIDAELWRCGAKRQEEMVEAVGVESTSENVTDQWWSS